MIKMSYEKKEALGRHEHYSSSYGAVCSQDHFGSRRYPQGAEAGSRQSRGCRSRRCQSGYPNPIASRLTSCSSQGLSSGLLSSLADVLASYLPCAVHLAVLTAIFAAVFAMAAAPLAPNAYAAESPEIELRIAQSGGDRLTGSPIELEASLFINGIVVISVPMNMSLERPDGTAEQLDMRDSFEGFRAASFTPYTPGPYRITAFASVSGEPHSAELVIEVKEPEPGLNLTIDEVSASTGRIKGKIRLWDISEDYVAVRILAGGPSNASLTEICAVNCIEECIFECTDSSPPGLFRKKIAAEAITSGKLIYDEKIAEIKYDSLEYRPEDFSISAPERASAFSQVNISAKIIGLGRHEGAAMEVVAPSGETMLVLPLALSHISEDAHFSFTPDYPGEYTFRIAALDSSLSVAGKSSWHSFSAGLPVGLAYLTNDSVYSYELLYDPYNGQVWADINLSLSGFDADARGIRKIRLAGLDSGSVDVSMVYLAENHQAVRLGYDTGTGSFVLPENLNIFAPGQQAQAEPIRIIAKAFDNIELLGESLSPDAKSAMASVSVSQDGVSALIESENDMDYMITFRKGAGTAVQYAESYVSADYIRAPLEGWFYSNSSLFIRAKSSEVIAGLSGISDLRLNITRPGALGDYLPSAGRDSAGTSAQDSLSAGLQNGGGEGSRLRWVSYQFPGGLVIPHWGSIGLELSFSGDPGNLTIALYDAEGRVVGSVSSGEKGLDAGKGRIFASIRPAVFSLPPGSLLALEISGYGEGFSIDYSAENFLEVQTPSHISIKSFGISSVNSTAAGAVAPGNKLITGKEAEFRASASGIRGNDYIRKASISLYSESGKEHYSAEWQGQDTQYSKRICTQGSSTGCDFIFTAPLPASLPPGLYRAVFSASGSGGHSAQRELPFRLYSGSPSISIEGFYNLTGKSGEAIDFVHTIRNNDAVKTDIASIEVFSELASIELFRREEGNLVELGDTNLDGLKDTGIIMPGGSAEIVVRLTLKDPLLIGKAYDVRIKATSGNADAWAEATDYVEIIHPKEDVSPLNYNDLDIFSIDISGGAARVWVRNNDISEKRFDLEVEAYVMENGSMKQASHSFRAITIERDSKGHYLVPLGAVSGEVLIAARILSEGTDYPDIRPQNNYRTYLYSPLWTEPGLGYRAPLVVSEKGNGKKEDYTVRVKFDFDEDADLGSVRVIAPFADPGKPSVEYRELRYMYSDVDWKQRKGYMIFSVDELDANAGFIAYVYFAKKGFYYEDSSKVEGWLPEIIIDNADERVERVGQWVSDYRVPGFYRQDYLHDMGTSKGEKFIIFRPGLERANYELYITNPVDQGFSENTPVQINHALGIDKMSLNQRVASGWRYMGMYELDSESKVIIHNSDARGIVVADAIKLIRILQYTQPGPVEDYGTWLNRSSSLVSYPAPRDSNATLLQNASLNASINRTINTTLNGSAIAPAEAVNITLEIFSEEGVSLRLADIFASYNTSIHRIEYYAGNGINLSLGAEPGYLDIVPAEGFEGMALAGIMLYIDGYSCGNASVESAGSAQGQPEGNFSASASLSSPLSSPLSHPNSPYLSPSSSSPSSPIQNSPGLPLSSPTSVSDYSSNYSSNFSFGLSEEAAAAGQLSCISIPYLVSAANLFVNVSLNSSANLSGIQANMTLNMTLNVTANASGLAGFAQIFSFPALQLQPGSSHSINLSLYFSETEEQPVYSLSSVVSDNSSEGLEVEVISAIAYIRASNRSSGDFKIYFSAVLPGMPGYTLLSSSLNVTISDAGPAGGSGQTEGINKSHPVQQSASVGLPVRWKAEVNTSLLSNISIPPEASNITVTELVDAQEARLLPETELKVIAGNTSLNISELNELNRLRRIRNARAMLEAKEDSISLLSARAYEKVRLVVEKNMMELEMSGLEEVLLREVGAEGLGNFSSAESLGLVLPENRSLLVEFETDSPDKTETLENNTFRILVFSNVSVHYTKVYANATLPEEIRQTPNITLFHWINGSRVDVMHEPGYNASFRDTDGDGYPDFVEWTVPHLSGQLFEVGEGSGLGYGIGKATRNAPQSVSNNTNMTVRLAVFNKGDKTLYNLTLFDRIPFGFTANQSTSVIKGSFTRNDSTYSSSGAVYLPAEDNVFFEGWESGSVSSNWSTYGNPGSYDRIQVTSSGCGQSAQSGSNFILMDVSSSGNYETNVLKSEIDLSRAWRVDLSFYHFESGEENHQIGDHTGDYTSCTGNSPCGDGVFFTCDGSYWYRLVALSNNEASWTRHNYNITNDPDWCGETGSAFAVKFMQHDNYACNLDGRGFDSIWINWSKQEYMDTDSNGTWHNFTGMSYDMVSVDNITVKVTVDSYNPEGSVSKANDWPDLQMEMFNGSHYVHIGNFSLDSSYEGTGLNTTDAYFNLTTEEPSVLAGWQNSSNQNLRIRAINLDSDTDYSADEINFSDVMVIASGETGYAVNFSIPALYPDQSVEFAYTVQSSLTGGWKSFSLQLWNSTNLLDIDLHPIFVAEKGGLVTFSLVPLNESPLVRRDSIFKINITNIGEHDIASGTRFTAYLPQQFTIVDTGSGTQSGQAITYTLGPDLGVGSSISEFNFTANVTKGGGYNVTFSGQILSHTFIELADSLEQDISGGYSTEYNNGGLSDVLTSNDQNAGIGHSNNDYTEIWFWQIFGFDVSSLGISGSQIYNFTFRFESCWSDLSSSPPACDTNDQPEYTLTVNTYLLSSSGYSSFGPTITVASGAPNPLLNNGDSVFNHTKSSGFTDSHISSDGYIYIKLESNGIPDTTGNDAHQGTDYTYLDLYYTSSNFSQDAFVRIFDDTNITFFSREVLPIAPSYKNQTNIITLRNIYNDTAVKINLTERITNFSCSDDFSPYFYIFDTEVSQGLFESVEVNTSSLTITWYGLELQVNEQATVNYTYQTPTCAEETLIQNAFNGTVEWEDLRGGNHNESNVQEIRIAAYNRAYVEYSMSPDEVTMSHQATVSLVVNSTGLRPIISLDNVSLVHPGYCSVAPGSISDGGVYSASARQINWSSLGGLEINYAKELSFGISCNASQAVTFNVTSFYTDLVGQLNTSSYTSFESIDIREYITTVWSPSMIEPSGSSTLTVTFENPFTGGSSLADIEIVPLIPLNWSINPSSQTVSSLAVGESANRQFLVDVNSTISSYNINTSIEFIDRNSVNVRVNITDTVSVTSSPNLVIIREMAPVIGSSGQDSEVRLFVYNNGNDMAYNTLITEYVNSSFWDGSGDVVRVLDGGTAYPASDTIVWPRVNITKSNYSVFRYVLDYNGAVSLASPTIYELSGDTAGWPYDFSHCNGGDSCVNSTDFTTYGIDGTFSDGWDRSEGGSPYDFPEDCDWNPVTSNGRLRTQDLSNIVLTSCSYGIPVNITQEIYDTIARGGEVNISFQHRFTESVGGPTETEDQFWIKARWHSPSSGAHYLGSDLDAGMAGADNTPEVFTTCDDPDSCGAGTYGPTDFNQNITHWIEGPGEYYFDFGHKTQASMEEEDGRAEFDNIDVLIRGPKVYNFRSAANYTDSSDQEYYSSDNATLGVRASWGSLDFNLTKREYNVSENFNTTFVARNVGSLSTDDDPKLRLDTTTNYFSSESPSTHSSGTNTITFSEGSISSGGSVSNWFVINSTVSDYHVLRAYGLESYLYSQQLFMLSKSGQLVLNITSPYQNQLFYQGDALSIYVNSTSSGGNVIGAELTLIPPGFLEINGSSSISVGKLTPQTYAMSVFNLTAQNRGYDTVLVSGTCTAGRPSQETVVINVTYAIIINNITLSHYQLEAGDTLSYIIVNSTNLGNKAHDINNTIEIYNSSYHEQDFGPSDTEVVSNLSVGTGQDAIAHFDNSGSGYAVPLAQESGTYIVSATSQPDSYDSRQFNATLSVVRVDINTTLNDTSGMPGQTVSVSVNISNGWSGAINFEADINITYNPNGKEYTSDWQALPALPIVRQVNGLSSGLIRFNLTSPSDFQKARAGAYTFNISVNYTDSNGLQKIKYTNAAYTIEELVNFTLNLTVPSRAPLGLNSSFTVNLSNTGNSDLSQVNISLIASRFGAESGFTVYPQVSLLNLAFNSTNYTAFLMHIPADADVGAYNATAFGNHSGFLTNSTGQFNVTRDILIKSVHPRHSQYEPGDIIPHFNITLESLSPSSSYYTSTAIDIFSPSFQRQSFGPNQSERASASIGILETKSVYLSNGTSGYAVPISQAYANYTVRANTTSNGSVHTYLNGSVEIVLVRAGSSVNDSSIEYNNAASFNITLFSNFSSQLSVSAFTDIFSNQSANVSQSWNIAARLSSFAAPSRGTGWKAVNVSPVSATLVEYGNYTIRAKLTYTSPNGASRSRFANTSVYVLPYRNISAALNVPTMSVGLPNIATLTIENLGNIEILNANSTLRIYNSTGHLMGWNITPSFSQLSNLSFGGSSELSYTVNVPDNTPVGNYTANFSIDFNGTESRFLNVSAVFLVSETIFMNISMSQMELEPGDTLHNISVNLSNINSAEKYNVTSWIEIDDPFGSPASWGPSESDTNNTLNLGVGQSVMLNWSNSGDGYAIPSSSAIGKYTVKAIGNVTNRNILLTFILSNPKFELVNVSVFAELLNTSISANQTALLNITVLNGFLSPVDFNATSFRITNASGSDFTSKFTISPAYKKIGTKPDSRNWSIVNITLSAQPSSVRAGTYTINFTVNYTDPYNIGKHRSLSESILVSPYKKVLVDIIPPSQVPLGLNSTFAVNVTNIGNDDYDGTNVTFFVEGEPWGVVPSSLLVSLKYNQSNLTYFAVEVPGNITLQSYTANATAYTGQHYAFDDQSFTVSRNIFTKSVNLQYREIEPGTSVKLNATIENTLISMNVSVFNNVTIYDSSMAETAWSPSDSYGTAPNNSITNISLGQFTAPSSALGGYTANVGTSYGLWANSSNSTVFNVSTVTISSSTSYYAVEANQTTNLTLTLTNLWYTRSFTGTSSATVELMNVTNSTGHNVTGNWSFNSTSGNVGIPARSSSSIAFTANTSVTLPSGWYNFTYRIAYPDPNTGATITKYQTQLVGFRVDEVSADFDFRQSMTTNHNYSINVTLTNIGSNTIQQLNVTAYVKRAGSAYWSISPSEWYIYNLEKSQSNKTNRTLIIPFSLPSGAYNATVNVMFRDNFSVTRNETLYENFTVYPSIDIDILADGREHALIKPGQNITLRIHAEDYADQVLPGVSVSGNILTFDNRQYTISGTTDSSGNLDTTLWLGYYEGGYYVNVTASLAGSSTVTRSSVILAESNKSVLVVADDNPDGYLGSAKDINQMEYAQILSSVGHLGVQAVLFNTTADGIPTYSFMSGFDAVVWSIGNGYPGTLKSSNHERQNLTEYLARGGGLVIEAELMTYDVYQGGISSEVLTNITKTIVPSSSTRINTIADDPVTVVRGSYHHPVLDGFGGQVGANYTVRDTQSGSFYKDKIKPNTQKAKAIVKWDSPNTDYALVYSDQRSENPSSGERTVYYSYSIDGTPSWLMNSSILNSVFWVMKKRLAVLPVCNQTTAEIFDWDDSEKVPINFYVRDYDSYDIPGLLQGSSLNVTVSSPGMDQNLSFSIGSQNGYYNTTVSFNRTGVHIVNFTASYPGHILSYGYCRIAVFDLAPPNIILVSPDSNYNSTQAWMDLLFNATDKLADVENCSLLLNGKLNMTNQSISETEVNLFHIRLNDGHYNWSVNCTDTYGNMNATSNRSLMVDTTGPAVTIIEPDSYEMITGVSSSVVNATATDLLSQVHMVRFEFRVNSTDSWRSICNLTSPPYNCTWNLAGLPEGNDYVVRVRANDTLGNDAAYVNSSYIRVDSVPPQQQHWNLSVANNSNVTRGQTVYAYSRWYDMFNISHALIEHNGSGSLQNYSITVNNAQSAWANYTMDTSGMSEFAYVGKVMVKTVYVNDTSGNTASASPPYYFYLWGLANVTSINLSSQEVYSTEVLTVSCIVKDQSTNTAISGKSVSFWRNSTLLGTNTTNSSGTAILNFNITSKGMHNISCNVSPQFSIYYDTGDQDSQWAWLNVTPFPINLTSPANGTSVDRDGHSASMQDSVELVVSVPAKVTAARIDFMANITDPASVSQENILLGTNSTIASGSTRITFNPGASHYAGRYTWWANNSNAYVTSSRYFDTYGSMNASFANSTYFPNSTYYSDGTVLLRMSALSNGPESEDSLNLSYSLAGNATLTQPNSSVHYSALKYNGSIWNSSFQLSLPRPGVWSVRINSTADYFFPVNTTSRTFTVYAMAYSFMPASGTRIDRDSKAQDSDSALLQANVSGIPGVNVSFMINLTSPPLGQQPAMLGNNVTNSSGIAVFNFNPDASELAGNYTWWANQTYTVVGSSSDFVVLGSLNLSYLSQTGNPDQDYIINNLAEIEAALDSFGSSPYENYSSLEGKYNAAVNATFQQPGPVLSYLKLIMFNSSQWNATYTLNENFGYWNVSLNATADYFYPNSTYIRNFTLRILLSLLEPVNGAVIDRDKASAADPDSRLLRINLSGKSGENITFWMNLTDPDIGETDLYLGWNLTDSSGIAVINLSQVSGYYAGNYTWWASHVNPFSYLESPNNLILKGSPELVFAYPDVLPDSTYEHNSSVKALFNASSAGIENMTELRQDYRINDSMLCYMASPSNSLTKNSSVYHSSGQSYNCSIFIGLSDEKGKWNFTVGLSHQYFYPLLLDSRLVNITKFKSNLSLWDQYDLKGGKKVAYLGENISFYANYTKASGEWASPGNCNFSFPDGTVVSAGANSTTKLYEHLSKVFLQPGLLSWSATCNSTYYQTQTKNDTIRVYPRTNVSVSKNITHYYDSRINISIAIRNLARYNEGQNAYDFVHNSIMAYGYTYGPNGSINVSSGGFFGNATNFNVTVAGRSAFTISYLANASPDYSSGELYIIGLG